MGWYRKIAMSFSQMMPNTGFSLATPCALPCFSSTSSAPHPLNWIHWSQPLCVLSCRPPDKNPSGGKCFPARHTVKNRATPKTLLDLDRGKSNRTKMDDLERGTPVTCRKAPSMSSTVPVISSTTRRWRKAVTHHPSWTTLVSDGWIMERIWWSIETWNWLVVGPPIWKIWKSIGMIRHPIYGKIKNGNQTTNQEKSDVHAINMVNLDVQLYNAKNSHLAFV